MRIAAYQFKVTGNIESNASVVMNAIKEASDQNIDLINCKGFQIETIYT